MVYRTPRELLEERASASDLTLADALAARLTALGHHDIAQRRALLLELVIEVVGPARPETPAEPSIDAVRQAHVAWLLALSKLDREVDLVLTTAEAQDALRAALRAAAHV